MLHTRFCRVFGPDDGDDVKTASDTKQAVLAHVLECRANQPPLLFIPYRLYRFPSLARTARLDFDKDKRGAILGDEIEFAKSRAKSLPDNPLALPLEPLRRVTLSCGAERHRPRASPP